jgi:hypothetical protein
VVLGVGISAYVINQNNQHDAAVDKFYSISNDVYMLQSDISSKITDGKSLLSTASANSTEFTDPKLLVKLQSEVDSAEKVAVDVPEVADDTATINKQIIDLTARKKTIQKQIDSLNDAASVVQKIVDQIAAVKEAALIEAVTPKDSHIITATDSDGNKETITIKIGKWIKGSETATLDKAWSIIGGTGSMPLTGSYDGNGYTTGGTFRPDDSAYVFGTVSIQNSTPDFSADNFSNGNSWATLSPQVKSDGFFTGWEDLTSAGFGGVVQCREYSTGAVCNRVGGSNQLVNAKMSGNAWGPVSFVIGVETVFTPKYPDGNPKLNDAHFLLSGTSSTTTTGDTDFQIGKSW